MDSPAVVVSGLCEVIRRLLYLQLSKVLVEPLQARLPEPPVLLDPARHVLEWRRLEATRPPLRVATLDHESRVLEHLQVLRDARQAHVERRSELGHRGLPDREPGEDGKAGRVGESSEGLAQRI